MPPRPSAEQPSPNRPDPRRAYERHIRLHRHRRLLIAGIAASFILASLLLTAIWYVFQLSPLTDGGHQQRVTVKPGDGLQEVGQTLERDGIIRNSFVFYTFGRAHNVQAKLKAGTYVFSPSQSVNDILTHLAEGRVDQLRVTIVPGRTLKQLKSDFMDYGYSEREIDAAFSRPYPHAILKDRPAGATLEGYIYPETYDVPGDGSMASLIDNALTEFEEQITENSIQQKLTVRNLTLAQSITLASIIQKEVPDPADQRQVSQIFQKRLKLNMPLGADATFVYAAEQLGVKPRVSLDSPYNTRLNKGLPPGPIGNFNMSALTAVAEPAPGEYVYFVSGDDGTTHYAVTLEQHEQNIRKYCKELCELF